jgi:hypothetical protein
MTAILRRIVVALLGILDEAGCECDACSDLHGYACRWVRDHGRREYRKDGAQMVEAL